MEKSRDFYTQLFGFDVAMDMGWVMTLVSPTNPTAQITLQRPPKSPVANPNISIEVTDVDAVHAQAVALGLRVIYALTDEPWGVRRFFVKDPNGVVINVLGHQSLESRT